MGNGCTGYTTGFLSTRFSAKHAYPGYKEAWKNTFYNFSDPDEKYRTEPYLTVTKDDVRRRHELIEPGFETVLVSNRPFNARAEYKPVGKTADRSFDLYLGTPALDGNYWKMEAVAAEQDRYYTFVAILSVAYMKGEDVVKQQSEQFLNDVREYFKKGSLATFSSLQPSL